MGTVSLDIEMGLHLCNMWNHERPQESERFLCFFNGNTQNAFISISCPKGIGELRLSLIHVAGMVFARLAAKILCEGGEGHCPFMSIGAGRVEKLRSFC